MTDYYSSMTELKQVETAFSIEARSIPNVDQTVLAIHGGNLETGTTEIAKGIAGGIWDASSKWPYWIFNSLRLPGENSATHVTSTNYNDPGAVVVASKASRLVVVHGCPDTTEGQPSGSRIAWVGGLNITMRDNIIDALDSAGFDARVAPQSIAGTHPDNICNQGSGGAGVQIEITTSLRGTYFFTDNTLAGRAESRTAEFTSFCSAVRTGML